MEEKDFDEYRKLSFYKDKGHKIDFERYLKLQEMYLNENH